MKKMERFVDDYPLSPYRGLVIARLLDIYYENQDWEAILLYAPENAHLCLQLQAEFHLGIDPSYLRSLAEEIWLTGRNLDNRCVGFLRRTEFNFYADPLLVWQRVSAAYEINNLKLVRQLSPYVHPLHRNAYDLWWTLKRNKRRIPIYARQMKDNPHYRDVLTYILAHYPSERAREGYSHYIELRKKFSFNPEQHKNIAYYLGLHMTINDDAQALRVMQRLDPALLEDEEHEWRARCAVKFQHWSSLIEFIDQFPPYLAQEAQWLFWKGYGLRKKGRYNQSIVLYREGGSRQKLLWLLCGGRGGR